MDGGEVFLCYPCHFSHRSRERTGARRFGILPYTIGNPLVYSTRTSWYRPRRWGSKASRTSEKYRVYVYDKDLYDIHLGLQMMSNILFSFLYYIITHGPSRAQLGTSSDTIESCPSTNPVGFPSLRSTTTRSIKISMIYSTLIRLLASSARHSYVE